LATTCIASTDMSRLCTDDVCTSNDAVAKCTQVGSSECYRWLFDYSTTTMVRGNFLPGMTIQYLLRFLTIDQTQHGCASSAFISTAIRTYGSGTITLTAPRPADNTVTATTTSTAYILTKLPEPSGNSGSSNIGAIVGGAVGGFAALSATGFGIFLVRRKLKKDKSNQNSGAMMETRPDGKPGEGAVVYQQVQQSELQGQSLAELSHPPQELDGASLRYDTDVLPTEAGSSGIERRASL
jgi:hypothetical protein